MSLPGIGVMLHQLGGGEDSQAALAKAIGKTISSLLIRAESNFEITFDDFSTLTISDEGQSCCESRYMVCDDDLKPFVGTHFTGAEVRDAPNEPDECGDHEVMFLVVHTSAGSFTVATHNEHNGYYGGFALEARFKDAPEVGR